MRSEHEDEVRAIVAERGEVGAGGELTLDSFAIVDVIEALEDRFGIRITAAEVTRDRFATLAALVAFVEEKLP
jgi:acyl carrier protein